jgi:type II secretory pathway predicted ATPase ExeA
LFAETNFKIQRENKKRKYRANLKIYRLADKLINNRIRWYVLRTNKERISKKGFNIKLKEKYQTGM